MQRHAFLAALTGLLLALGTGPASAEILSASFKANAESLDLTAAGTLDWAVFGLGDGNTEAAWAATDFRKGGSGIARAMKVSGLSKAFGGDGVEGSMWTSVSWAWTDGTNRPSLTHRNGDRSGTGMRLELLKGGVAAFDFAAPGAGKTRVALLLLRRDKPLPIVAVQGGQEKVVDANGGKSVGLAVVKYDGAEPLTLEIRCGGQNGQARGFAAALCDAADFKGDLPAVPTLQDVAMKQGEQLGDVDFLKVATDFADCMIKYGRDRYGKVHSPLFAVLLTREKEPKIGPEPYFARPSPYKASADDLRTPFHLHDFNKCLNYPPGLGGEGPHKVTLTGCDPYEDQDLYEALFELTRITGKPVYREEAEKALEWWFTHTQGPAGLYPWGEHLGWDFEYDCPTYFDGPSKNLYSACYHEVKDYIPFLDILAGIPAAEASGLTPLERYAMGIWNAHFWDKEHCTYCRHGDYTGQDTRTGSDAGFPAHLGAYLRVWAATYLNTKKPEVKATLDGILNKVADMAVSRTEKYGFFPFTFAPELKGADPGKEVPGQSLRLAHHAIDVADQLAEANPQAAAKLRKLARLHLGAEKVDQALKDLEMFKKVGERSFLQTAAGNAAKPEARVRDLSKPGQTPNDHANEIIRNLLYWRQYGDAAYLKAAETYAKLAYVLFCDGKCPLPKARAGSEPIKTTQGEPFPDFTFHGARLMRAFALLGEAERKASQ